MRVCVSLSKKVMKKKTNKKKTKRTNERKKEKERNREITLGFKTSAHTCDLCHRHAQNVKEVKKLHDSGKKSRDLKPPVVLVCAVKHGL